MLYVVYYNACIIIHSPIYFYVFIRGVVLDLDLSGFGFADGPFGGSV